MARTNIKATKAYKLGNSGENKVLLMLNSINDPQYNIHNINFNYKNSSYHGKNNDKRTVEVLITNY